MRDRLTAIAFGLAVAAAIFLLIWHVYAGFDGELPTHATLIQMNGWWVVEEFARRTAQNASVATERVRGREPGLVSFVFQTGDTESG
jgi:hypothetical protein